MYMGHAVLMRNLHCKHASPSYSCTVQW